MFKLVKLIGQRLGLGVLVLFAVSLIIFLGVELLPGDLCQEIQGQDAIRQVLADIKSDGKTNWVANIQRLGALFKQAAIHPHNWGPQPG